MRLSDFIENNLDQIVAEWEEFAKHLRPAAEGMTREELRNFVTEMLRAVAADMRSAQSEEARHEKSRGGQPDGHPGGVTSSGRSHAAERLMEGFTLSQLVAEYRALRASVIRRWRAQITDADGDTLEQLTRFNEAIDESLTEAIGWYNARLEEARDLLNGVLAHDLRTPLGATLASAEVLLHDDTLNAEQTRTAIRLRNSATRMRKMITDLLDFTRTRLGTGLPMSVTECDMATMVRDVCEEQQAFHAGATIRCETRGNLRGEWDQDRIEQMLANLIGNAVEHGKQSPVTVIADAQDDEVTVTVHNQGGEIPEQEQRVIFDPLRRAAVRRQKSGPIGAGLGLGLYIARQIAEAHGGGIDVDSSPGAGTTFAIQIPRKAEKGATTAGLT